MSEPEKKPYLNALVESRRLTELDEAYEKIKDYAAAHGLIKPAKGVFISALLGAGLKAVTPEIFFNNPRS